VPVLVVLVGADDAKYTVSRHCLDKYSRQLYTFGIAAMAKMMNSKILVSGLSGIGCEVAKNVILAGAKSVRLHDERSVAIEDLSSQFYLSEADVGQNRAECSLPHLRELNELVKVDASSEPLACTADSLGLFTVVVLVNYTREKLEEFGAFCHAAGIGLIAVGGYGLYGYVFSDLGPKHIVSDANGQAPRSGLVVKATVVEAGLGLGAEATPKEGASDTEAPPGSSGGGVDLVILGDNEKAGIDDGDLITLSSVIPPQTFEARAVTRTEKRGKKSTGEDNLVQVRDTSAFAITMSCDTHEQYRAAASTGYWTEVKRPLTVEHVPFATCAGERAVGDAAGRTSPRAPPRALCL
jgi:molybdopterin/thiamine biosynthesis adenylyltransferase